jgi:hypothetical protein
MAVAPLINEVLLRAPQFVAFDGQAFRKRSMRGDPAGRRECQTHKTRAARPKRAAQLQNLLFQ